MNAASLSSITAELYERYSYLEKLLSQDFVFQPGATAEVRIHTDVNICDIIILWIVQSSHVHT